MDDSFVNRIRDMAVACQDDLVRAEPDGAPSILVPEGYRVHDLESTLLFPVRARGTVSLRDTDSFVAVVKDRKGVSTQLYGKLSPPSFTAVFNDTTGALGAGWRDDRATYACPMSVEWQRWSSKNGQQMNQEAFAQFIEDNAADCVTPDAATMIEVSRTLEAKKKVNFASGIRLSNGQSELTYEETVSGTAGKGKFTVPEEFTIGIAVLEGGPKYAVVARLRYRIADQGKLTMWFDLLRPHKVLEDAVKEVWNHIQQATALTILNGDA